MVKGNGSIAVFVPGKKLETASMILNDIFVFEMYHVHFLTKILSHDMALQYAFMDIHCI